ncbi:hypothetical protein D3C86_2199670 [compost metagenome]
MRSSEGTPFGRVRTKKMAMAASTEVTARPYRPPWIEPVCCSSRPKVVGATKPPRLPTELIKAITAAAMRASR